MDRVGVLVVSKCLSASAIVDTFLRSESYRPEFYFVEKQANPFNRSRAKFHAVVPDLNLSDISRVARRFRDRIDFGLTDTEDFVIKGGRDVLDRSGVQMLCVSKKFAVERSKAGQRVLFSKVFSEANPEFTIFERKKYRDTAKALVDFRKTGSRMEGIVVKPDAPARGAGVGVWGSDFTNWKDASAFFLNLLSKGDVVVEEKITGEESSFQAFSDGKHFVPGPLTRDYKRSLDENRGRLTGGMGSYRGAGGSLPFIRESDWDGLVSAEETAFRKWKGKGSEPGLKGIVLYDAIMHTGKGFKVLERNSRGGNTESVNLYSTLADDLADICYRILDSTLRGIHFRRASSVVTCAVPLSYGEGGASSPVDQPIDLAAAYRLASSQEEKLRVYPMDVREGTGTTLMGASRSVAVAGIGDSVEEARESSLRGVAAIVGKVRWRGDIGSIEDIAASRRHFESLRASV